MHMNNHEIIELMNASLSKYGNLPFDKALPQMREDANAIADKEKISNEKVWSIYMDWLASQKED